MISLNFDWTRHSVRSPGETGRQAGNRYSSVIVPNFLLEPYMRGAPVEEGPNQLHWRSDCIVSKDAFSLALLEVRPGACARCLRPKKKGGEYQ